MTENLDDKTKEAQVRVIEKMAQKEELDTTGHNLYFKDLKKNNTDAYGKAIVGYAELWGKVMQIEMKKNKGRLTKNIVEYADGIANKKYGGISGYMYYSAQKILATCWKYGFKLAIKTEFPGTSKIKWLKYVISERRKQTDSKLKKAQQKTITTSKKLEKDKEK